MIYLKLFWSFFQIGLFSFGGGLAALPLIQNQVVEVNRWLTMSEFTDVITISQMMPGSIAINSSTFVGMQIAGPWGALISTFGCVLPSCIVVLTLAYIYYKYENLTAVQGVLNGLRPVVVALIASAGLSILITALFRGGNFPNLNYVSVILFVTALFVLRKFKPSPILVMAGSGLISIIVSII